MRRNLTFTQRWVVGTLLSSLPLLLAVGYAVWSFGQLNKAQKATVEAAVVITRQLVAVEDEVEAMERYARQFSVVQDMRLRQLYDERLQSLRNITITFTAAVDDRELRHLLGGFLEQAEQPLVNGRPGPLKVHLDERFSLLSKQLNRIADLAHQNVNSRLKEQQIAYSNSQRLVILLGLLAIPGTFLLQTALSLQIARPLQHLSRNISAIGSGLAGTMEDVEGPKEFEQLGQRLKWLQQSLRDIEAQKNQFLRHVTHELKTPLAVVTEASSLLEEEMLGPLTQQQKNVVRILNENIERLQEMIQQLLNFNGARLQAGCNPVPLALAPFMQKLTGNYLRLAESRQVSIHREGDAVEVVSDPMLLEMVISNLLSNAVHFSPETGRVVLSWGLQGETWWCEVSDEGPGIPQAERANILQPFYQGANVRQGSVKGSGLGLAIVNECTHQLGAQLDISDNTPRGCRMRITFPLLVTATQRTRSAEMLAEAAPDETFLDQLPD